MLPNICLVVCSAYSTKLEDFVSKIIIDTVGVKVVIFFFLGSARCWNLSLLTHPFVLLKYLKVNRLNVIFVSYYALYAVIIYNSTKRYDTEKKSRISNFITTANFIVTTINYWSLFCITIVVCNSTTQIMHFQASIHETNIDTNISKIYSSISYHTYYKQM